MEEVLPRHRSGHHGDWHISLSKPSEKEQHLLMTLVGEQGEQTGEVSHHRPIMEAQERTERAVKLGDPAGILVQGSGWSDTWVVGMRRQVWASHSTRAGPLGCRGDF